ncbi:DUF6138 family protein [Burkholderia ubonensis]|uniref:DUF6138 family protein n=1 Tax=Burkholderia ubonensis TaxID=101571 RepID=UPI001160AF1B|nr:DUF6138 family protein [Burkholderia ubonensis]
MRGPTRRSASPTRAGRRDEAGWPPGREAILRRARLSSAFRSPAKHCLPVKGLPKKGVHQLFANATGYPELRPFIAQYARLAMREHEWYTDIDEADPAMPGTFAVFDGGGCVPDHAWKAVVHAIWGEDGSTHPETLVAEAPLTSSRHCTRRCRADRACGLAGDNPD